VSSASPQSSVVAPRKLIVSSWVKFTMPSGLLRSSCMSPCIERFRPLIVRVLYLVSPVTATVHVWSPISYFGEQVGLNTYVL